MHVSTKIKELLNGKKVLVVRLAAIGIKSIILSELPKSNLGSKFERCYPHWITEPVEV